MASRIATLLGCLLLSAASVAQTPLGSWNLRAELSPADAESRDRIGNAAALLGDLALIGATGTEVGGQQQAGVVHVFRESGGDWTELTTLRADDASREMRFGTAVAASGDRVVVGAPFIPEFVSPTPPRPGSAYVFVRDPATGTWTQEARLIPSDQPSNLRDEFGAAVAIDGDRILVGAPLAGRACVFARNSATGAWAQEACFTPPTPTPDDRFGSAVALSGTTALVGAPGVMFATVPDGRTAHVFSAAAGTWTYSQALVPPSPVNGFGARVALDGPLAVVSSVFDASLNGGSAHAFLSDGSSWTPEAVLVPFDNAPTDRFGFSLGLDGSRLLVGAPLDGDIGQRSGSVSAFSRSPSGMWTQTDKLRPMTGRGQTFGSSVSLSGDRALVGAPDGGGLIQSRGQAYILTDDAPAPLAVTASGAPSVVQNQPYSIQVTVTNVTSAPVTALLQLLLAERTPNVSYDSLTTLSLAPGETLTRTFSRSASQPDTYRAEVRVVDMGVVRGWDALTFEVTRVVVATEDDRPGALRVDAAPNPLSDRAAFTFALAAPEAIRLAVYDALGREVAVVAEGPYAAGEHRAVWSVDGLPAGVYLWRIVAGEQRASGQITVVR